MTPEQWIIFGTLALTLFLFISGWVRYDVAALIALLIGVLSGVVPAGQAFSGFSNPAVVTVALVLVLSQALQNAGVADVVSGWLLRLRGGMTVQLAALTGLVALLSAFMNNIGALALLLPVAIQVSRTRHIPISALLMPMAFASLLGGMTTLIGTPPNILAATFRAQTGAPPFGMFDFTPVGLGVAVAGLAFIVLGGWRLIPVRPSAASDKNLFEIENYVTEVRILPTSKLNGRRLSQINDFSRAQTVLIGLVRDGERRMEPPAQTILRSGDILILSADSENIKTLVESAGLELVGSQKIGNLNLESDEVILVEAVVMPDSMMIGGTARSLNLRANYGVNLLAISRQNERLRDRLDRIRFRGGDVLLLQSHVQTIKEVMDVLGCLPLAGRGLKIGQGRNILLGVGIFGAALLVSAFGILSVQVAFLAAVLAVLLTRLVSLREAYASIDWPIIILLGAMIPIGEALETTGGAQLIAGLLLNIAGHTSPVIALILILVVTMFLSDVVNNAAALVLMAPIGIRLAQGMGASADPFLMALTIGASCAFLTPIGHQSNTLVMGPGGYKFGDYWRIGLPLEAVVLTVAIPLIFLFWPLF